MPTKEEIYAAIEKGKKAVLELFDEVGRQVEELAVQLEKEAVALKELQERLSMSAGYNMTRRSQKPGDYRISRALVIN
jgi:hypothetical protein